MNDYIIIDVPDMNDSVSRIAIDQLVYNFRFTYDDTSDFWKFGVYDANMIPIVIGIKIVPNTMLNLLYTTYDLPEGVFAALSRKEHIGRDDFKDGKASFVFFPVA